jgi:pimeloyl-ACP methyl ester carboxylesterase
MAEYVIRRDGVDLSLSDDAPSGARSRERPAVVLLHGLTATRRYVVMGSSSLARSGHRVIAYDARGHGHSDPAPEPGAYDYAELGGDLLAVLDGAGIEQAVLAGASMGAHTLLWLALHHPERVAGAVVITPAYAGAADNDDPVRLASWDRLAAGLRDGGIDGFLAAQGEPRVPGRLQETVRRVIAQRLARHDHLDAVADALAAVPRSHPFAELVDLRALAMPVTVVASDDEADPDHPRAIGEAYAQIIPGAELITDEPGRSPVAWQGSQLSRIIAAVVARSR